MDTTENHIPGLCDGCGCRIWLKSKRCRPCAGKARRDTKAARRKRLIAEGICPYCMGALGASKTTRCQTCTEKAAKRVQAPPPPDPPLPTHDAMGRLPGLRGPGGIWEHGPETPPYTRRYRS